MKKMYFAFAAFLMTAVAFSQGTITGTILDGEYGDPLPGANVMVEGTSNGTATDFDGNFTLQTSQSAGTLVISYVGFITKKVAFTTTGSVGSISLMPNSEELEGVVVIASVAVDRKTPVAVSTIKANVIENKLGSQEFPEILKSTPSVYATKQGGGYGDSRISVRGFNSTNVAVMINGVPVNDMENGTVYWSNWAGLADVTSSMQIQRGLGASKVAVPSIGGTINIITKNTDAEFGGNITTAIGNDGYQKYGATLSTGLLDNGWAVSASGAKITGNGYVDGTEFNGSNYFFSVSKQINDKHMLSFSTFGAPQWHGQRQNKSRIDTYRNAESGIKFNPDWGIKNGSVVSVEDNFYHKSQTSLTHYWNINDKSLLSTSAYVSFGRGGGGGTDGDTGLFNVRLGGDDQPIDLDNIVAINRENGENGEEAAAYLRASMNSHNWYGVLSSYKNNISDNITILGGLDIRQYRGIHYSKITDLLGASYVLEDSDVNNPNRLAKVGDKQSYYNDGVVGWQGLFGQVEYQKDDLAAFVSVAGSNTSYKRVDYFNYLDSDPNQESDRYNFVGYSVKGGANYNLTENHNVFANIGYFERAPDFNAVFTGYTNELEVINADAENQKIFSIEVGYGYRSSKFNANVNLYRTEWNDRSFSKTLTSTSGENFIYNLLGVNALHQGIELDFNYKPIPTLTLTGMLSLGDWKWNNNLEGVQGYDEDQNPVGEPTDLFIKGLYVSDAAQTTAALGLDYQLIPRTNFTIDYNYYANYYADFDPTSRSTEAPQAWEMPDYGLFDASLRHSFDMVGFDTTLTFRMNNVFNTEYISDATDGNSHTASDALVWYGFGRTFNISAKFRF